MTPYCLADVNWRFGGTFILRVQGAMEFSEAGGSRQQVSCCQFTRRHVQVAEPSSSVLCVCAGDSAAMDTPVVPVVC